MATLLRIVLLGSLIVLFLSCLQNANKVINDDTRNASIDYLIAEKGLSQLKVNSFNHIFAIKDNNILNHYDELGTFVSSYQKMRFGHIYDYAVNNSLRYTLFYRDFKKIVILDRYLAEEQIVDLEKWALEDVSAVSPSLDNKLWLFDRASRRLLKYDLRGNQLRRSDDLFFNTDVTLDINYIEEYGNMVYLMTTDGYIIEMDNLGNYLSTWSFYGVSPPLYFNENQIIFRIHDEIYSKPIKTRIQFQNINKIGKIPTNSEYSKADNQIYILDNQGIYILSNKHFRQG